MKFVALAVATLMTSFVMAESRFPEISLPKGVSFGFNPSVRNFSLITKDLKVKVDGVERQVRSCRVSAHPFNRIWPGYQRSLDQTEMASYLAFEQDGAAAFEVRPGWGVSNAVVRPISARVRATVRNGVVSFTIPKPGYYSVEFDGTHKALHVFMDSPRVFADAAKATLCYGPGVHVAGVVKLRSGDRVYIDPAAVVFGSFQGEDVHDVRVFGNGVIDGSVCERIFDGCYTALQPHGIHFYRSSDVVVDGPILLNSACWCMAFFDCEDVKVSHLKVVGQWRYNTDGIDICNSRRVSVTDCFVRAFDDVISIKGVYPFLAKPVEDVSIERCVLWCGWGNTIEPGIETFAPYFRNLRFEDCDLIHNAGIAIDAACGGSARLEKITYRNLRVELQNDTEPMIMQKRDDQVYDSKGRKCYPTAISLRNDPWGVDGGGGSLHDVLLEDIDLVLDPGVPPPLVRVSSSRDRNGKVPEYGDICISGLTINGKAAVPGANYLLRTNVVVRVIGR